MPLLVGLDAGYEPDLIARKVAVAEALAYRRVLVPISPRNVPRLKTILNDMLVQRLLPQNCGYIERVTLGMSFY